MKYKHVIWDWNGTLLDDVALGHETKDGCSIIFRI